MRELDPSTPRLALIAVVIDNTPPKAHVVGSISLPEVCFLTALPVCVYLAFLSPLRELLLFEMSPCICPSVNDPIRSIGDTNAPFTRFHSLLLLV